MSKQISALLALASWLFLAEPGFGAAPTISGFNPFWGVPGTQITITGAGFIGAGRVEFGDERPGDFQIVSDSKLIAVVPADGLTGPLTVTAASGPGISGDPFYVSPRIETFDPTQGTAGTTVTINGANFLPNMNSIQTWVVFGTVTQLNVNVTAPTQLQVSVPVGATNSILHVYTGAGGATSVVEFIASPAPLIRSVSPENGLPGQNVPVVIYGANFQSATNVSFGGTNALFSDTAETQISTSVPAGAKTGKIRVGTTTGEAFSDVVFVVGPTIEEFRPLAGQVGDSIVVDGNDFNGLTNVAINGVQVVESAQTAKTQLSIRVPAGATTGKIVIGTTNGIATSTLNFTVGPFISGFTPTSGPVGSWVQITGAGFDQNTRVFFGNVESLNRNSPAPNLLNATVPTGATNARISVVSTTATNRTVRSFLVTAGQPVIEFVEPGFGVRGGVITLRGANFNGTTAVTFGGVPAGFLPPAEPNSMKVAVPPGALTGPLRVTNGSGTGVSPGVFYPAPWTTQFYPAAATANTVIELNGTNYVGAADIYFGGQRGHLLLVEKDRIYATVTQNARTGPIQINTPGGTFITSSNFVVLPKILDVAPLIGPVGTPVVILGTSFFNVTNVAFNGTAATFTTVSPEEIHTTVPTGATSGLIRVGTTDGESVYPAPFTVTKPSDLAVSGTVSTNFVPPGGSVTFVSTVTNRGPSAVTGVMLTNTFVVPANLLSAVSSQGGCEIDGTVVRCGLGVMQTNSTATVTIVGMLPLSGLYTNAVRVGSVEGDPQTGNNVASTVVVVASQAERTLDIELLSASHQVVISWKASQVPFRLQAIPELGNTNVHWSNYLNGPFPFIGTNRVTNGTPYPERYYRLAY